MQRALFQPELLAELNSTDLLNLCSTNKAFQQKCTDDNFWSAINLIKFGPAVSKLCSKEIYLIKSFIRENEWGKFELNEALNKRNFKAFERLLKIGVKFEPADVSYFRLDTPNYINTFLDILQKYNYDLNIIIDQMVQTGSYDYDIIFEMSKRDNVDLISNHIYFPILEYLFEKESRQVKGLELLKRLLNNPKFNVNELDEDYGHLLGVVEGNKQAVEMILAKGVNS